MNWLSLLFMITTFIAGPARAQDDDWDPDIPKEPSCFNDRIRVSALISTGEKVKVGLVETMGNVSYLISPGEFAGEVEVLAADYETETVTLRLGAEICTLNLSSDPNAPQFTYEVPPDDGVYRGEAIEQFLRENPDAVRQGMVKFVMPYAPEAAGKGEGIEAYLREHPDVAAKVDQPLEGRGEGIESYLKAHPEVQVPDEIETNSFDEVTEGTEETDDTESVEEEYTE